MLRRLRLPCLAVLLLALTAPAAGPLRAAEAPAQAADSLTRTYSLDDSLALALKNDSRLLTAEQDRIIAQERVTEAKLLFLPEFGLQASATKFESRYPFALSQEFRNILLYPGGTENIYSGRGYMHFPIYEGRRTINTLRLTQAAQKRANSNYDSVRMDIIHTVKEAFYRLLLAQDRAAATREAYAAAESAGANPRLDVWERIEVEAMVGAARIRAAETARELAAARLAFLKTLNVELDTAFTVSGSLDTHLLEVDSQKAVLWAMELRPELQSETYRAEMDAIGVNLALGRRNPTVFVAGDYEVTAQRFPLKNNNWDIGVGIKIPLTYDFLTKLRQKKAEQRQGQLKRASIQDQVRFEVRQACEVLQHWQKELPLREALYRKVSVLYESAPAGSGAPMTRLRGLMGFLDLRLSYMAAATEHLLARASLERAVGRDLSP